MGIGLPTCWRTAAHQIKEEAHPYRCGAVQREAKDRLGLFGGEQAHL